MGDAVTTATVRAPAATSLTIDDVLVMASFLHCVVAVWGDSDRL
jgi:hypothetical protein